MFIILATGNSGVLYVDTFKQKESCNMIMYSKEGGVDIEQVAENARTNFL